MSHLAWIQRASWLALLLSAACSSASASSPEGGQTGGEEPPGVCDPDSGAKTALDPNAKSASGFSANDVLAQAPALNAIPLKYAAGGSSTLALDVQYAGPSAYDVCKEVELGVRLHFASSDGVFDEALVTTLRAGRQDQAMSATLVPRAALQGSFASTQTDAVSTSAQTLRFSVAFVSGKAVGNVSAYDTQTRISTVIATF